MKVTSVKLKVVNQYKVKAFAEITFDDCFTVKGLKIISTRASKLFVTMPNKLRKDGSFADTAFPLNNETRDIIETAVLGAYKENKRNRKKKR